MLIKIHFGQYELLGRYLQSLWVFLNYWLNPIAACIVCFIFYSSLPFELQLQGSQPSLFSDERLKNPSLHWSQVNPWTLVLQSHWPAILPAIPSCYVYAKLTERMTFKSHYEYNYKTVNIQVIFPLCIASHEYHRLISVNSNLKQWMLYKFM